MIFRFDLNCAFAFQENNNSQELLNILRYVRPGNNFEPLCTLFEKIEVNGKNEHELYTVSPNLIFIY